jgi:nicotinamidase-related amidase
MITDHPSTAAATSQNDAILTALDSAARLLVAARASGVPVVHTRVQYSGGGADGGVVCLGEGAAGDDLRGGIICGDGAAGAIDGEECAGGDGDGGLDGDGLGVFSSAGGHLIDGAHG